MKKNNVSITLSVLVLLIIGYFIYTTRVRGNAEITKTEQTESLGDKQIDNLMSTLNESMENYMRDASPSYSQQDIDSCVSLLSDHVVDVFKANSKDQAMSLVKSTVLKLNNLNEKCEHSLIETNEREQIVEIIILAGYKRGFNTLDQDITEEWREW